MGEDCARNLLAIESKGPARSSDVGPPARRYVVLPEQFALRRMSQQNCIYTYCNILRRLCVEQVLPNRKQKAETGEKEN